MTHLKIILLGESAVGKTTCWKGASDSVCDVSCATPTIGVDCARVVAPAAAVGSAGDVSLMMWDTAGQESFRSLVGSYYRGVDAAVLVYDVTAAESAEHLGRWLEELRQHGATADIPCVIVGNKVDLLSPPAPVGRVRGTPLGVAASEAVGVAEELAQREGLPHFLAAATQRDGFDEALWDVVGRRLLTIRDADAGTAATSVLARVSHSTVATVALSTMHAAVDQTRAACWM
jgi:small GTP-binding protein